MLYATDPPTNPTSRDVDLLMKWYEQEGPVMLRCLYPVLCSLLLGDVNIFTLLIFPLCRPLTSNVRVAITNVRLSCRVASTV